MNFVTGCARSGTTLTMSVLRACGANLGNTNTLNEITGIRDGLVKPYLKRAGADPLGQHPLPDHVPPDDHWRRKVEMAAGEADVAKIIKGVLFWPLWVQHFPEARWLIVMRDPERIAQSCVRTSFMRAYTSTDDWRWWAQQYHARCSELAAQAQTFTVWPGRFVRGDFGEIREAVEFLGYTWNEAAREVVNPSRWHG
jgi:hypothetical protein